MCVCQPANVCIWNQKKEAGRYVSLMRFCGQVRQVMHGYKYSFSCVILPYRNKVSLYLSLSGCAWHWHQWYCHIVHPCAFPDMLYQFVNEKYGGYLSCQDTLPFTWFKGVLRGVGLVFLPYLWDVTPLAEACASNEFRAACYCLIVIGASTSAHHHVHLYEIRLPENHHQFGGHLSSRVLGCHRVCVPYFLNFTVCV